MVAGSNPVSPTPFRQVKCYFYLLPKVTTRVHLIRCQRRPDRRIFAWHEIGADLRVLSSIFPAYGGMR